MFVLDNIKREVQEGDQLCWAAVSTMAVRAFKGPGFVPPTQRDLVVFKKAEIKTVEKRKLAEHPDVANPRQVKLRDRLQLARGDCGATGSCNLSSAELWLFDLKSATVPAGKVLSPEHFRFEIGQRQRPVAIRWNYRGQEPTHGRIRTGDHALIVTGFNPLTHELRVFDPWPANADPDPLPAPHEKWIPYETYLDPQNEAGMDAVAVHQHDEFKLRRVGETAPTGYPPLDSIPQRVVRRENSVNFEGEIPDLRESIEKHLRTHVVRKSNGDILHGPYEAAAPIPVVPLAASRLMKSAKDTDALFAPTTSAVVVPLLKDGKVVDSIQMLHDRTGWHAGGYSNNKIASLLCEAREMHTCNERHGRGFYLVSMPELGTFYVAHGFRDKCSVAALSKGGMKDLRGGREAFAQLIKRVRCD
jgi:hypothetical protein